jgi:hypothetical protein
MAAAKKTESAGYWRVTHVWLVSGQSLKTHGGA